jgi:hypothetical protein
MMVGSTLMRLGLKTINREQHHASLLHGWMWFDILDDPWFNQLVAERQRPERTATGGEVHSVDEDRPGT